MSRRGVLVNEKMDQQKLKLSVNILKLSSLFYLRSLHSSRAAFCKRIIYCNLKVLNTISRVRKERLRNILRKDEWWQNIIRNDYPDEEMLSNFRMSKKSFFYIVERLEESLKPSDLAFTPCLDVKKIVAVALFKLASCAEYRVVGIAFGIHKCTVKKCLYRVCECLNDILLKETICLPTTEEELKSISEKFEDKTKMGPIAGVIDGTHIPITPPRDGYRDYVNRKGFQFVSSFCRIVPRCHKIINEVPVRSFLIGDPAYPLLPWLIKGYTGIKTEEEESFNAYLNSGRVIVEQAIGRLKNRWRILCKRTDINYKFVPIIVSSCCILHNIVERNKERFIEMTETEQARYGNVLQQPSHLISVAFDDAARVIRNRLKNELHKSNPLRRSNF